MFLFLFKTILWRRLGFGTGMTLAHNKTAPGTWSRANGDPAPKVSSALPLLRFHVLRASQQSFTLTPLTTLPSVWAREQISYTLPTRSGRRPTRSAPRAALTAQTEPLPLACLPHSSVFHSTTVQFRFSHSPIRSVPHRAQSSILHTSSPGCRNTLTRIPSTEHP